MIRKFLQVAHCTPLNRIAHGIEAHKPRSVPQTTTKLPLARAVLGLLGNFGIFCMKSVRRVSEWQTLRKSRGFCEKICLEISIYLIGFHCNWHRRKCFQRLFCIQIATDCNSTQGGWFCISPSMLFTFAPMPVQYPHAQSVLVHVALEQAGRVYLNDNRLECAPSDDITTFYTRKH